MRTAVEMPSAGRELSPSLRDEPVMGRISVVASRLTQAGAERWEKAGRRRQKRLDFPAFSHHFPAFPTFSHLDFFCQVEQGVRSQKGRRGGIMWEKVRIITGSFTKVRESSHRSGP